MEICLRNLSKAFDTEVLHGISYTFTGGKLYVIKGVSGCGKSTLLNLIGGVDREYQGELIRPEGLRSAYIFQQSLLLSGLSVRENLLLIRPDAEKLEALARQLSLSELLDRRPETLSGGERQRAAVLRALLNDAPLLLADEPTASLDAENARSLVALIAGLRSPDRIILVATHDSCFDEYADAILDLDYGVLRQAAEQTPRQAEPLPEAAAESRGKPARSSLKNAVRCVFGRRPELLRPKNLLIGAAFFLVIFLIAAVQNNIVRETVRLTSESKPIELLLIEKRQMSLLTDADKRRITFYENVTAADGDMTAFYLLPREFSVLAIEGMLSAGRFPKKEEEVLVNESLAASLLEEGAPVSSAVGRSFSFCGLTCRISGIVGTYKRDFRDDFYYRYGPNGRPLDFLEKHLFMPYERLKTIGTARESDAVMASWRGLFNDTAAQTRLQRAGFSFNQYFLSALEKERSAALLARIVYAVLLILFLVTALYSTSLIRLELHFRRKELGYLQIFGLEKRRVSRLIRLEYALKMLLSFVTAAGLYLLIMIAYRLILGAFLWPKIGPVLAVSALLCLIDALSVRLTVNRFLRQPITRLIGRTDSRGTAAR